MMPRIKLFGSTALATLCLAQGAAADLSPQQVWDDMSAYMSSFGYEISATESRQGADLLVSDLEMSMVLPEGEGNFAMTISELRLTDLGDGTVEMTFPPVMPMDMTIVDGETVDIGLDYKHSGMTLVVSGEPNDLTYTYAADSLEVALSELAVDGEIIPAENASFSVQMNSVSGESQMQVSEGRSLSQSMSIGALTYDIDFTDPEDSQNTGSFRGNLADLVFSGEGFIPAVMNMEDPVAMMTAGFAMAGEMAHGGGEMQFSVSEYSGTTNGATSSTGGSLAFAMGTEGMTYGVGGTGVSLNLSGPEIPLPVSAEMEELAFNLKMPLLAADIDQDFALGLTLRNFTTADMIWGIFDPGAVLPRDPATIAVDITGKAKLFMDLMDEDAMMEAGMSDEIPGELTSLAIEGLTVSAVGAELTGGGDFTFDNTDLETFDGMPRPIGKLNLSVSGANALIDNLIRMGLVSEQDAMGARMMMSMFTIPGQGEDESESTIEFNEQGHILANGQRIK